MKGTYLNKDPIKTKQDRSKRSGNDNKNKSNLNHRLPVNLGNFTSGMLT